MKIRAVKLRLATEKGDFGFEFRFSDKLTIIRAKNSSGKSTLFNCLLYGLGMEELIGGRNEKTLPYAVKERLEYDGHVVEVTASEVYLEIQNGKGRVVTLRRAIRDEARDPRLIELFEVPYLTSSTELGTATPTYLHDGGGAKRPEGFHRYLEAFMGLELPQVAAANGGEVKLYLQTVFAAMAVEQKRGWTDYVANIPYFGVRDARTRVVEFILGLNTFDINAERARLNAESVEIDSDWRRVVEELRKQASTLGVVLEGVSPGPTPLFDSSAANLLWLDGKARIAISAHIADLRAEYQAEEQKAARFSRMTGAEAMHEVAVATSELQELNVLHERASASLEEQRSSVKTYETLLAEANEDLDRNKTTAKLREFGAQQGLKSAIGRCPTCNQPVEDTLLADLVTGPQMDLATNIAYLESQRRMLQRQIAGVRSSIQATEVRVAELEARISKKHDLLTAMRGDVSSGASESKAIVRRQVQIEVEVEALQRLLNAAHVAFTELTGIADRLRANQVARQRMPKDAYAPEDVARLKVFEKQFRANAGSFGYTSARIEDIEIGLDGLVPCLAKIELKEIRTDIKSDSSASDFVRLIWSYLLALYQTSNTPTMHGNHPGLLMLDEPGQHSMAETSQHALLQQLAGERGLQSIVAASFDESDEVFRRATAGLEYALIHWDGKLLRPLEALT